jgi:hypothetical protein
MSSSQTASASNKESVAAVLTSRGFKWRSFDIEKVQHDSRNVSFGHEWNQFASLVAAMTRNAVGDISPLAASDAWTNHFQKVMENPDNSGKPGKLHGTEKMFKNSLFEALRGSLTGFIYPMKSDESNTNLIMLQCTGMNVGFGREINREKLGFNKEYGLSKKSQPDLGCFVFGTKKRESPGSNITSEFHDMTAVVELKLESSSCRSFAVYNDNEETVEEVTITEEMNKKKIPKQKAKKIQPPDFEVAHSPMGQAIFYSMDVWHCLARRGVRVTSVPVVLLAGKSEPEDQDRICCLEAHIQIPEYCGRKFVYSVDRIVSFDGTMGLEVKESVSPEMAVLCRNTRNKRAIAIVIRTMRNGLELAMQISKNQEDSDAAYPPLSLFCRQLLKSSVSTPLIASPIPDANYFQGCSLRVRQGELFQITNPTKKDFSGLSNLQWYIKVGVKLPDHCLVKVSCAAVHNMSVSNFFCDKALEKLHGASASLKEELSKVLLGFCYIGRSLSLLTILKDLRVEEKKFKKLEHHKMYQEGKLFSLWSAFCVLVRTLLLPMANVKVVHLDIRSDAEVTHNILVYENQRSVNGHPALFELYLIDFDSVVFAGSTSGTRQIYGIYWEDLENTDNERETTDAKHENTYAERKNTDVESENSDDENMDDDTDLEAAHRYLFWQVLWIAYTWYPAAASVPNTRPQKQNARTFVESFFEEGFFVDFKNWLKIDVFQSLKSVNDETITADKVHNALDVLGKAFSEMLFSGHFPEAANTLL